MQIHSVGIDLGKTTFHLVALSAAGKILRVEGTLQNQDGVISVKASAICVLDLSDVDVRSHDFH